MEASDIRNGQTYAVRIYGGRTGQSYEAVVVECLGTLSRPTYNELRMHVEDNFGKGPSGVRTRAGGNHFVVRTGTEESPTYYVVTSRHFVKPWADEQKEREAYQEIRDQRTAEQKSNRDQAEALCTTLDCLGIESAGFAYYHGAPCLWITLDDVQVLIDTVLNYVR